MKVLISRASFLPSSAIALFFVASLSVASAEKLTPPEPQPLKPVSFPEFTQKTLANGLRVVVIEHHEQPAVSLQLVAAAGRLHESQGRPGVAAAVAALLTEGTESRSAQQIAQAIDFVGGQIESEPGWDSTYVSVQVTSDQIDLGLDLLADVARRPIFADEEVERWRKQALSGLQVSFADAAFLATEVNRRLVFGAHPYAHPKPGTPESVATIDRQELRDFHRAHYLPNTSILAVVGDVRPAEALEKVAAAFGDWQRREASPPPAPATRRDGGQIVVIDKPDAVQTEIRLGQLAIARRDPDYFIVRIFNAVVGGSSGARLFQEVREKRGLSYGATSWVVPAKQPGYYQAQSFTKTETTVEALDVMLDVIRGMQSAPVPEAELKARKAYLTGSLPLQIETPDGIATQVLRAMEHGFDRAYLQSYNHNLDAVTSADVQRFARTRMRPEQLMIVLVGNAAGFAEALQAKHGSFTTIPLQDIDLLAADLRRPSGDEAVAAAAD